MVRNKVTLIGRIAKDITVKKTTNGDSVTTFPLAVSEGKDAQGNDKAIFVNCTAWKGTADLLAQYCKKGDRIGVEGHLVQKKWEERQVTLTEVVIESIEFLQNRSQPTQQMEQQPTTPTISITDDELPF